MQCPAGVCAALAAGQEGGAGAASAPPPPLLSLPCVPRAAFGGLPHSGVPCPRLLVRHSMCSARSASSVRLPFRCALRVCCVFVCSRSRGGRVSPPPVAFWCVPYARFPQKLLGPLQTVHAPPRFMPRSLALPVVGGGGGGGLVVAPLFPFPGGVDGCPGSGTLPPPTAPPWGRRPGSAAIVSSGAGSAGLAATHETCSARPCRLVLCAVGAAGGHPRLVPRASLRGVWGRVPSLPRPSVLGACSRGLLPFFCGHRGCGREGPSPTPQRALASWLCVLWGLRWCTVVFATLRSACSPLVPLRCSRRLCSRMLSL